MKFWDLMEMSCGNLWRRKLRTFLTVLGVVIGTASIVVMVSLGLALNKSTIETMESSGGLTTVYVEPPSSFYNYDDSDSTAESSEPEGITDSVIEELQSIQHVTLVSPVLQVGLIAKQGNYINTYLNVIGMSPEALEQLNIDLSKGRLPSAGEELAFVYGNQVINSFEDETAQDDFLDYSYYDFEYEEEETPDVDLEKPIYYIFDSDAYYETLYNDSSTEYYDTDEYDDESDSEDAETTVVTPPKKYLIPVVGIEKKSDEEDIYAYSETNYNVYCDVEALVTKLRQVFKNKPIPDQPTTKSGKAYKQIYYTQAYVRVDNMDNVEDVQKTIKALGYNTEWNGEWIVSEQKQYRNIQLILGGIGAVSLFVAAIGIANTMMMSIYERTKEIGILKVLGCSLSNIRTMFLVEASMIGLIGGVVGLVLSEGISWLLNHFGTVFSEYLSGGVSETGALVSYIPLWLAGLSLLFAILVGAIAGFFPSLRAMHLSPLAAIRNE